MDDLVPCECIDLRGWPLWEGASEQGSVEDSAYFEMELKRVMQLCKYIIIKFFRNHFSAKELPCFSPIGAAMFKTYSVLLWFGAKNVVSSGE